jgi:hypothetical protein
LEEDALSAAIARILPDVSAASVVEIDTFVQVTLFSGRPAAVVVDLDPRSTYSPGEWFEILPG